MSNQLIMSAKERVGPEHTAASRVLADTPGAVVAFVVVITDESRSTWSVRVGSAGEPQPDSVVEEFRSMLHQSVDHVLNRLDVIEGGLS